MILHFHTTIFAAMLYVGFNEFFDFLIVPSIVLMFVSRSLQGNQLSGPIPPVIGLMQALAVL